MVAVVKELISERAGGVMDWIKKLFQKDYALLRTPDGHIKAKVEWFCGRPYASPYLKNTRTELLPDGRVDGACYVKHWRPVTARMEQYFKQASK